MSATEPIFYRIGKTAFLPFLAGMFFFNRMGTDMLLRFSPCIFRQITGLYCPGCGGTRAFCDLAKGNWAASLRYHPVVLYTFLSYMVFMTAGLLYRHTGRPVFRIRRPEYLCYLGIVLILVQWILKCTGLWTLP